MDNTSNKEELNKSKKVRSKRKTPSPKKVQLKKQIKTESGKYLIYCKFV